MQKFGLIGRTLKHSYSKQIHNLLGDYVYDLYELEPNQLFEFVKSKKLKAFNVTIPYKKDVMSYLDVIDESARLIGSVNTVIDKNGKLIGYNTDFKGMIYMLSRAKIEVEGKKVLILGSGGTSNTAQAVAKYLNAKEIIVVSRSGKVNYENYLEHADAQVVINTTPVGMYPNTYAIPIDLNKFNQLEGVVDAIYNPNITALTFGAMQKGVKFTNGLPMLVAQAKYANEYFFDKKVDDGIIEQVIVSICKQMLNVVLIGMPGCGKTTIGKALAEELGYEFIDTDALIVEKAGMDIPSIFATKGEEYFRQIESQVVKEVAKYNKKIIATGGGVVKNQENYFPLKSNGKIFWLDRKMENLETNGRPLSKDLDTVKKLYEQRKPLYEKFADFNVNNDGQLEQTVKGVINLL